MTDCFSNCWQFFERSPSSRRSAVEIRPYLEKKTVLIVGSTGDGKSFIGNQLVGRDVFESNDLSGSVTQSCTRASGDDLELGAEFKVVDTIGLLDESKPEPPPVYDILKGFTSLVGQGVHAIVVVLPGGRCQEDSLNTLEAIETFFGPNVWAHSIVVYNKESRTPSEIWRDTQVERLAQFMDKWECQGADLCAVRDARDGVPDRAFASDVLELKRSIMRRRALYTPEMFHQARKDLQKIMEQAMQDIEPNTLAAFADLIGLWRSNWPAEMEKLNTQLQGGKTSMQEYNDQRAEYLENQAHHCNRVNQVAVFSALSGTGLTTVAWGVGLRGWLYAFSALGIGSAGGASVTRMIQNKQDAARAPPPGLPAASKAQEEGEEPVCSSA